MPGIIERWRNLFRPSIQIMLGSDAPAQVLNYSARELYNTQDNLSAVINFMANSIAQLPLKVYTRKTETDRERDRDSVAAKLLYKPNEDQTEYEFIRGLLIEYFLFGCVTVWTLPDTESDSGWQLRIIPSDWVVKSESSNQYAPDFVRVATSNGNAVDIPKAEFVQFKTYSPGNPGGYVSPVASLRQILQEQIEAGGFRKELWHSSGRLNAQILRPANVERWDDDTRERFIKAFREGWGSGGKKAGGIPLLEDGMEIKPYSTSFKEQQWAESVKLSRETVAAAYGINPSLIWHTDSQTYASSKDNARALYAECLGPILQMIQQRINTFLLPKVGADRNTYVEFYLDEKLKGSFEERANIMQRSVGAPWLTRNEARGDSNLPPIEGGDELVVPLNVSSGRPAEPKASEIKVKSKEIRIKASPTEEEEKDLATLLAEFFKRQKNSILPKLGVKPDWWDGERWDKELMKDLEPLIQKIADEHGLSAAEVIETEYEPEKTKAYIRKVTENRAKIINEKTHEKITESDEPAQAFEYRENHDAPVVGKSLANFAAGWAVLEAASQALDNGYKKEILKEWVTGANPRPTHAAMNGERVPIDEPFSNGAMWPGDDILSADESCGCNCTTEVIIREN